MKRRIGFDMGGVLTGQLSERRRPDGTYGLSPGPKLGATEVMAKFLAAFEPENVLIVSRASQGRVAANWMWMFHWFRNLNFLAENIIIFDGPRSEKKQIVERLSINVMVDDRFEVLCEMPSGVELIAFSPDPVDEAEFRPKLGNRPVTVVRDWTELAHHFGL